MKSISFIGRNIVATASAIALAGTLAVGLAGCSSNDGNSSASSSAQVEASSSDSAQSSAQNASSSAQSTNSMTELAGKISPEEALQAALDKAGLKESEVRVIQNSYDLDDGIAIYEIEFIDSNNMEYEIDVDANSGDILSYESEMHD